VAPSPTPSPTTEPSPEPSPSPEPVLGEMPRTFGPDLEPSEIPAERLVPNGADLTGRWFGFTDEGVVVLVAWVEPGGDLFRLPRGFAVWTRYSSSPHWRAALVERHPANERVQEIQIETTDLTGDGSDDALVFEGVGGSGACGLWLVIDLLRIEPTFDTSLCDGRVAPAPPGAPGLEITESVFRQGDAHCCPSAIRRTTLAWDGAAWRVTARDVTPT
jgi:hypothetical protein